MPRYKRPPAWKPEWGKKAPGAPLPTWAWFLICAAFVVFAWIACFLTGTIFGVLANAFGCHPNEASDGGCPFLGNLATAPMLIATFGIPLFILALGFCLVAAVLSAIFDRGK